MALCKFCSNLIEPETLLQAPGKLAPDIWAALDPQQKALIGLAHAVTKHLASQHAEQFTFILWAQEAFTNVMVMQSIETADPQILEARKAMAEQLSAALIYGPQRAAAAPAQTAGTGRK